MALESVFREEKKPQQQPLFSESDSVSFAHCLHSVKSVTYVPVLEDAAVLL